MTKVLTDSLHRIAYSTDASIYREVPQGVAYPQTEEDIVELVQEARRRKTCLIPRAAGTSIAGQVVGKGIVVNTKGWNKTVKINPEERWARVQPGVVRDELNLTLKPYGLHFSPETSTSNRCCIGGMFDYPAGGHRHLPDPAPKTSAGCTPAQGSVPDFQSQESRRRRCFQLQSPLRGTGCYGRHR